MKNHLHLITTLLLSLLANLSFAQGGDRGCVLTVTVDSVQTSSPQAQDGSLTATATGGTAPYTYQWYSGQTTQTVTNLGTSGNCVTVTDVNGCTAWDCGRVTAPGCESFNVTLSYYGSSTPGDSADATISAQGGDEPYSYIWSTGATGTSISNVAPGIYCVTVTDEMNCSIGICAGERIMGIENNELAAASIYPNPVHGILNIDLPGVANAKADIISIDGKVLLHQNLVQGNNSLSTNSIAAGMYICRISNREGTVHSNRKILIE